MFGKAAWELGHKRYTLTLLLNDMLASDSKRAEDASADGKNIHSTVRKMFSHLESDGKVVDHYRGTLLQKYWCYPTHATSKRMFPFRGRLFITMSNIAM